MVAAAARAADTGPPVLFGRASDHTLDAGLPHFRILLALLERKTKLAVALGQRTRHGEEPVFALQARPLGEADQLGFQVKLAEGLLPAVQIALVEPDDPTLKSILRRNAVRRIFFLCLCLCLC